MPLQPLKSACLMLFQAKKTGRFWQLQEYLTGVLVEHSGAPEWPSSQREWLLSMIPSQLDHRATGRERVGVMERTADVVIIGAGVIGTSTAFQLVQRGVQRVVVLEKSTVAAGSSGKSSALVRMH
jgi:hypothetical protein